MAADSIHEFKAKSIDGKEVDLKEFKGKVLLIVNVASECGLTPQYEQLQALHEKYGDKGLVVIGFPCNQFGSQEPKNNDEIQTFCSLTYHVTFPMFSKIEVNGNGTHPLFVYLKSHAKGLFGSESIKWNFTKFLVGRDGKVIERYAPAASPMSLTNAIERALSPIV